MNKQMVKLQIEVGKVFHIDSKNVKQYENERIVDDVTVENTFSKWAKQVLVYSPKLKASVLVPKKDLKEI